MPGAGRLDEAFPLLERGLALREALARDDPSNLSYRRDPAFNLAYRGYARKRAGQNAGVAADLRRAVELLATDPASDIHTMLDRARALALLAGLGEANGSGVTTAEANAFAAQAVAVLRSATQASWA